MRFECCPDAAGRARRRDRIMHPDGVQQRRRGPPPGNVHGHTVAMTIRINRHMVADERIVAATDDFPRRVAALVDAEQEAGPAAPAGTSTSSPATCPGRC
ncbi:hypothetical protein GCM10009827_108390 [Dactylosporangium maewongense]|uniref:Uncharacterized protein n=1 Tax=Dactylosporangium maewongense TaxID=634393 RepID=A0ABP4NVX6_9ACTN